MVDVCTVNGEGEEGNAVGTCRVVSKNVADMEWSKGDVVPVRRTLCEEKARCPRPRRSEFKRLYGRKSDKSTPAASREILPIGHVTVLDAPDVLDKQLIVALHFLNSLPPHSSSNFVPAIRYRDHVKFNIPSRN
ncbi:unnamed protein product [Musa acuminata var. zebrina]